MTAKDAWSLAKHTLSEYSDDNVPRLAAALAYYTVFSLAPMLVLSVVILGFIYGDEAAQGRIAEQLTGVMGASSAQAIQDMLAQAEQQKGSGVVPMIISIVMMLFGASVVFGELQSSLNTVFDVRPRPDAGFLVTIKKRLLSMGLVLAIAFLLLVSLVVSTVIAAFAERLAGGSQFVAHALDLLVGTGVIALLFAAMFKYLPDVDLEWRDVWIGAVVTAVIFTAGRFGLSWYLSRGSTTSAFGAAGSLAALLIWIYYSSHFLFVGAELTQVYANRHGSKVRPEHADVVPRMGEDPSAPRHPSRAGDPLATGRYAASAKDTAAKQREHARQLAGRPAAPSRGQSARSPAIASHSPRQAQLVQMQAWQMQRMQPRRAAIPAMSLGSIIGSTAALVGVYLRHKLTETRFKADHVDQRLRQVEHRVGSLQRLERMNHQDTVDQRVAEIEDRILTAARAAGKLKPVPLKDRLAALLRQ